MMTNYESKHSQQHKEQQTKINNKVSDDLFLGNLWWCGFQYLIFTVLVNREIGDFSA